MPMSGDANDDDANDDGGGGDATNRCSQWVLESPPRWGERVRSRQL